MYVMAESKLHIYPKVGPLCMQWSPPMSRIKMDTRNEECLPAAK